VGGRPGSTDSAVRRADRSAVAVAGAQAVSPAAGGPAVVHVAVAAAAVAAAVVAAAVVAVGGVSQEVNDANAGKLAMLDIPRRPLAWRRAGST
jgi:hypothetical protein